MARSKPEPRPLTNITEAGRKAFASLQASLQADHGAGRHALFSCFLDGKPAQAVVLVTHAPEDDTYDINPQFLFVDDDIMGRLTDHDGKPCAPPSRPEPTPEPEDVDREAYLAAKAGVVC